MWRVYIRMFMENRDKVSVFSIKVIVDDFGVSGSGSSLVNGLALSLLLSVSEILYLVGENPVL
jgi:hypothetical protein